MQRLARFAWGIAVALLVTLLADPGFAQSRKLSPKAPARVHDTPVQGPALASGPSFDFERLSGPVNEALTVLLADTPVDDHKAGDLMTKRAEATVLLQRESKTAAATVIAELNKLGPQDVT